MSEIRGKVTGVESLRGKAAVITTLHTDAYLVAVRNGFDGTEEEWLESLKGDTGDKGEPGVGIASVKQTTTSTADEGENIVEVKLTDGASDTFKVRNGSKGSKGDPGYTPQKGIDYFDGKDGKDGAPVTVQSVNESTTDGGSNVVTFSDGQKLTVKNGRKGADGYTPVKGVDYVDGKDGYTPVKGKDYFDGIDGKDGIDGYTPVKGVDYFDGKDGKDGAIKFEELTDEEKEFLKGDSGVHVGSDTPPENANVWIDPNGSPSSTEVWTFTLEDGTTVPKTVVVLS